MTRDEHRMTSSVNKSRAALARDAAIDRVIRTRRWVIVAAAALTAGFAALVSALAPGRTLAAKAPLTTASTSGAAGSSGASGSGASGAGKAASNASSAIPTMPPAAGPGSLGLQGPAQAPQSAPSQPQQSAPSQPQQQQSAPSTPAPATPAPAPAPAPPVVSGGS